MNWIFLLASCLSLHSAVIAAESRIWTSRQGATNEAELLKVDANGATLVTKAAKQITVKFEDLSLGDRQYLVEFGGADAKILTAGEVGEPENQVRIDSSTIKRLKDKPLVFGKENNASFELTESEHFLIATAGNLRAEATAETAERLWHGMAFQHMNFRRDWGDKRMLVILAEERDAYAAVGKWYQEFLTSEGAPDAAARANATWDKLNSTSIFLSEELTKEHNLLTQALLFNVIDPAIFKKKMHPFTIHTISGALLSKQLGGVSEFGSEGYFALTRGYCYYKEISLAGKSETHLLSVSGSHNDEIGSARGFEDGTSWARGLRAAVRKDKVKVELEPMLTWTAENLTPEQLVLIYSFGAYLQSTPQRFCAFASMVRRIESSNQIPPAIEIAKIFGFDSVEAINADWALFIKEGKFK